MTFILGKASRSHLIQGKTPLIRVVEYAIKETEIDFSIVDCRRTKAEQRENIDNGVSWTMDSRHLPDPTDNLAFAVDLYPWHKGKTDHAEWLYRKIAKAMFASAIKHEVDIEWGGFWTKADNPHWQLSHKVYPLLN